VLACEDACSEQCIEVVPNITGTFTLILLTI